MKVKTFIDEDNANAFIETVELGDKGSVQYSDGEVIVFYSHAKVDQNTKAIKDMIDGLEATVFNTNIRLISLQADIRLHTDETKIKETKDLIKETEKNLALYRARQETLREELKKITVL